MKFSCSSVKSLYDIFIKVKPTSLIIFGLRVLARSVIKSIIELVGPRETPLDYSLLKHNSPQLGHLPTNQ